MEPVVDNGKQTENISIQKNMPSKERPNSITNPLIDEKPTKKARKTSYCTHFSRCCITFFVLVVLIIFGCVAAFFLWARKPEIKFEGLENPDPKAFQVNGLNFSFDLKLKFLVDNPNYVGAVFDEISVKAKLPIDGEPNFGHGHKKDLAIGRQSKTNVVFPLQLNYNLKEDKGLKTIKYIAEKCGLLTKKDKAKLNIKYAVDSSVKILFTVIDLPVFSSDVDIDCPIPAGTKIPDLDAILNLLGSGVLDNLQPDQIQRLIEKINSKQLNQVMNNSPAGAAALSKLLGV